jgi:hypothetical protein
MLHKIRHEICMVSLVCRNFQTTWNLVDVNQRGTIPVRRVKFILRYHYQTLLK